MINILNANAGYPGKTSGFQGLRRALARLTEEFNVVQNSRTWPDDILRSINELEGPVILIIHVDGLATDLYKNGQLQELLGKLNGRAIKVIAATAGNRFDKPSNVEDVIFGADDEQKAMLTIKQIAAQLPG